MLESFKWDAKVGNLLDCAQRVTGIRLPVLWDIVPAVGTCTLLLLPAEGQEEPEKWVSYAVEFTASLEKTAPGAIVTTDFVVPPGRELVIRFAYVLEDTAAHAVAAQGAEAFSDVPPAAWASIVVPFAMTIFSEGLEVGPPAQADLTLYGLVPEYGIKTLTPPPPPEQLYWPTTWGPNAEGEIDGALLTPALVPDVQAEDGTRHAAPVAASRFTLSPGDIKSSVSVGILPFKEGGSN